MSTDPMLIETPDIPRCCSNCIFAFETAPSPQMDLAAGATYECRRMPPQVNLLLVPGPMGQTGVTSHGSFPPTKGTNWCGEHVWST